LSIAAGVVLLVIFYVVEREFACPG